MGQRRWAWLAVVAGGAVVLAVAVPPWHRSGIVARDGFALARVADNLGLVSGGGRRLLFTALFLVPLLAGLSLLAAAADRVRLTGFCSFATGVVGLASAAVAIRVTGQWQSGPVLTGAASALAAVAGVRLASGRGPHR